MEINRSGRVFQGPGPKGKSSLAEDAAEARPSVQEDDYLIWFIPRQPEVQLHDKGCADTGITHRTEGGRGKNDAEYRKTYIFQPSIVVFPSRTGPGSVV